MGDWNFDPPAESSSPGTRIPKAPDQLPEVIALRAEGWNLAPDAPVWAFLPAVWPRRDRTWVADRSTLTAECSVNGSLVEVTPWTHDDYLEQDRDLDETCALAGVPARPKERLWLLRVPGAWDVEDLLDEVIRELEDRSIDFAPSTEVTRVTTEVIARVWRDQRQP